MNQAAKTTQPIPATAGRCNPSAAAYALQRQQLQLTRYQNSRNQIHQSPLTPKALS